ncbi:hypothetical protein A3I46_01510 [Candidatus Kaiserbacteria bacterium RIFCSPLOWO2_02_FULL_54_13]|uniref:Uncharacterized protein n=1 Tax=Candidatus Kaiserbacteria bacterium RIFCSPHIGHO2_02_FULL_54_22 TaxID=1798495 RepID=A0A1F6DK19_9BACT|nr:MAG: hypothetical protein A3C19_00575 [Candidatus Kaiserbacteria bacterium RIFCSPHIGHO2_02_FULL_54_22]OGG68343.1 MAG: hypothetical protein A3E99_02695 [Candidatus Kaiserbacteria bacterium RIFCSPHIGHO2_12_FULL_54_16]OGG82580.1 MAG: hypothetical protein A3I46_01510 [Candidatus Kaiserbacteria bacterium RIFCSPLOWO2_02_FULL_54_13]OGG89863.1 MAG: hypothetical protein A3G12_02730 [Candidatus Kaiserbacteria bacterium RIFCSPLOWO2_12_FULL_54_10]
MKYLSFCLKWFFLIFVPLFSPALIAAGAYMLWNSWGDPKKVLESVVLVAIGFIVWYREGGFVGWRPSEFKAFKRNWEKFF